MSEPFLGEIRMVGFGYAPRGWMLCAGQTLAVAQYTALFSLLGTTYGGDGIQTFKLPDLRGRGPVGAGQGPGLTPIDPGEIGGVQQIQLTAANMPTHTHQATFTPTGGGGGGYQPPTVGVTIDVANTSTSNLSDPTNNIIAVPKQSGPGTINAFQAASAKTGTLGGVNVTVSGGSGGGGGGPRGG